MLRVVESVDGEEGREEHGLGRHEQHHAQDRGAGSPSGSFLGQALGAHDGSSVDVPLAEPAAPAVAMRVS